MDERTVFQTLDQRGYLLLPKVHPDCLGYGGLIVCIRENPTSDRHNPRAMHLWTADRSSDPSLETLTFKNYFRETKKIIPGRVVLFDDRGEKTEFFSFGGQLESISIPDAVVYKAISQAPILELYEPRETIEDQLAFETEGLLAKQGVSSDFSSKDVMRQLAQIDPMTFYQACLQSILIHYQHSQELRDSFSELYYSILKEQRQLIESSQWQPVPDTLKELLDKFVS